MTQSLNDNIQQGRIFLGLSPSGSQTDNKQLLASLIEVVTQLQKKKIHYKMLAEQPRTTALLDSIDQTVPNNQHSFGQAVWGYPEYFVDHIPITSQINAPVLVVAGKKDYAIGPKHHLGFHFPQAQVIEIDGSHTLYIEKNEEFHEAVRAFVRQ